MSVDDLIAIAEDPAVPEYVAETARMMAYYADPGWIVSLDQAEALR